jgi:hypothetical protein
MKVLIITRIITKQPATKSLKNTELAGPYEKVKQV